MQNLINASVPATVAADATTKLTDLIAAFKPYTVGLTVQQREELPKLGEKSAAYIDKVGDFFGTHADLIPNRVSAPDFTADAELRKTLAPLRALALTLFQMIDDTMMAAGSDLMEAGSAFYRAVQDAADDGDAAAKVVYEELKKRYPSVSRRAKAAGGDQGA